MTGGEEMSTKVKTEDGERPQRMKDWLIEQINSGKYDGLNWVDDAKTIFKVPWIHAKKRGYDPTRDAALFKAWATHTGKYKGDGDATTWKINFRCALNGLKDIVELKDEQTENFRVYRLLPDTGRKRKHDRNSTHRRTDYLPEGGFSMCIPPYPFIPYPQPGGQAFVPVDPCTYPCPDLSTQWKQPVFNPFQEQVAMYDSIHCTPKPMGFGVAMPHITGSTAEPSRVPTITGPGLYEHRQTLPPPYPEYYKNYNEECPISPKRMQIKNNSNIGPIQSAIPYQNNVYTEECPISPKTMKVDPTIGHLPCIRYQETVYQETHPGYTDVGSSSPTSTCNDSPLNVEDSPPLHPHVGQSSPNCPVTPPYHVQNSSNAVTSQTPVITSFIGPYDPLTPPQNANPPTGPCALQISLCYGGVHRTTETISCPPAGCHISSDLVPPGSLSPHDIDPQLKLAFPFKLSHDPRAQQVLKQTGRGLLLSVVNGDVYLKNLTNLPCYFGTSPASRSHVSSISPEMLEPIFSFASFKEVLSQVSRRDNAPSPSVAISLGQPWGQGTPLSNNMVTILVTVLQAQSELDRLGMSVAPEHSFCSLHSQISGYEEECPPPQSLHAQHQHGIRLPYTPAVEP